MILFRYSLLCTLFLFIFQISNAQIRDKDYIITGPKNISTMKCLGTSMPLSNLPDEDFTAEQDDKEDGIVSEIYNDFKRFSRIKYPNQKLIDPLVQNGRNNKYDVLPTSLIEGISMTNVVPPDPSGDIGKEFYMQMVNAGGGAVYQVYNRAGQKVGKKSSLNSLWKQFGVIGLGDPIVLYDETAERWLIAEMCDRGTTDLNKLLIAVSVSANPLGAWYAYELNTPSFPDFPKFFIWNNGYYVTTNEYVGEQPVYALERSAMLEGKTAQKLQFGIPRLNIGFQIAMGVDWDGRANPNSLPMIMQVADNQWDDQKDRLQIYNLEVDWKEPSNSLMMGPIKLPVADFNSDICIGWNECIQQSNGRYIAAIDQLLSFRLNYRNFGTYESVVCCHNVNVNDKNVAHAGIRWYELRKQGKNDWSIYQQGTFSPDSSDRFYPSISIDGFGNIALAYSVLNKSSYPSLRYVGRRNSDPLGEMGANEYQFATGLSNSGTERWGDYHHMSVDPVDSSMFWFTGEYMNSNGQWATKIVQFRMNQSENDLSPVVVVNPKSSDKLTNSEQITIQVKNFGKKDQKNFEVGLVDENGNILKETINSILPVDSSMYYTFNQSFNFDQYKDYKFKFFTSLLSDNYPNNDTLNAVISHRPMIDAAITDVKDLGDYSCGNPHTFKVFVNNSGFDTIRTLQIGYQLNTDTIVTKTVYASLLKDNNKEIELTLNTIQNGQNQLAIFLQKVNETNEIWTMNDTMNLSFVNDTNLLSTTLTFFTNSNPTENYWNFVDSKGKVVAAGGPYDIGTKLYKHKICLPKEECFTFNLFDSRGDGMVSGTYFLRSDALGKLFSIINPSFGFQESNYFCTNKCALKASVNTTLPTSPNAKDGIIEVKINGGSGPFEYSINNVIGKSNIFSNLEKGIYTINVKDDRGCTDSLTVLLGVTANQELENKTVSLDIVPNPTNGFFEIIFNGKFYEEDLAFQIYNSTGQYIMEAASFQVGNSNRGRVNLTNYPKGMYWIKVYSNNQYYFKKVVVN